ncbi:beta-1,6-N-acetylglucosaminyltransferase [uncultured Lentilactobacillus sp.]|uniref:beta-1,6-N-acetylglucosaminyltransferase n=1 Tax=uncultured Lentilactobacillus sp. TaxID=2805375 RepID=UPI00259AE66C|nr:beta-1,6-N-acetylglucosaminyltransferase [uncultured Lentilactobacillus sp.]
MEKKHAYLIIANNKFEQLGFLLQCLDHPRNDFFILVDKKSSFTDENKKMILSKVSLSNVFFCDRIPIFWGHYTQIKAEMKLFQMAFMQDKYYSYFHLLSGVDMPIVPVQNILNFFDQHPNHIFLTMANMNDDVYRRVQYKYRWIKYTQRSGCSKTVSMLYKILNKISLSIQTMRKVDYFKSQGVKLGYASNWVSLDRETVQLLIDNTEWIRKTFKYSYLCDELFIPTLLNKYPKFKRKIFYSQHVHDRPDEFQGNLRYINWWGGRPTPGKMGINRKLNTQFS